MSFYSQTPHTKLFSLSTLHEKFEISIDRPFPLAERGGCHFDIEALANQIPFLTLHNLCISYKFFIN